jgi:hypothetical protein
MRLGRFSVLCFFALVLNMPDRQCCLIILVLWILHVSMFGSSDFPLSCPYIQPSFLFRFLISCPFEITVLLSLIDGVVLFYDYCEIEYS